MFNGGGGSTGSGMSSGQVAQMLTGYASQSWVSESFVSIDFFRRLFAVHGTVTTTDEETGTETTTEVEVLPNDLETLISNIEAKIGLWTQEYLSALGLNDSGGGSSGVVLTEPLKSINEADLATHPTSAGQTIVWDGTKWTYGNASGGSGSVTSVGLSVPTGFSVSNTPITSSGTIALAFSSGYSLPTTAKQSNWDTAYGWGDHAGAGYAMASAVEALTTRVSDIEGYFTDGVANSALQLANTRTIWGQSFNGTQNITGSLTSVTSITMTGTINIGGFIIQYDSTNNALKFNGNIYATGGVSALGLDDQGQSLILNQPLSAINDAGLDAPTDANVALVWDGTKWDYSPVGSGSGSVTSVAMTVPTGFRVTGTPITSSGTLAIKFASGYSLPTTYRQGLWNEAYGWGDHSQAGYLTTTSGTFWGQSWSNGGTVTGSLTDVGSITMSGYIVMANNTSIQMADANSTNRVLLTLNSGNVLSLGYGTRLASYDTRIEGNTVNFMTGTGTDAVRIDEDGMLWVKEAEAGIRIGDGLITWDATNNALKVSKYDGTTAHLYALGGISALGISSTGSTWNRIAFDDDHYIYLDGNSLKFYNGSSTITIA